MNQDAEQQDIALRERRGLPGIRGTDHIGFTVPDMEQAHEFFVNVIGCQHVYSLGPYPQDPELMQTRLTSTPRQHWRRYASTAASTGRILRSSTTRPRISGENSPATVTLAVITSPSTSRTST